MRKDGLMSVDTSPVMPGTRNATLPDMVEILRTQRARRLDVVAPAAAIHAHDGNLVIDSTVSHLGAATGCRLSPTSPGHPPGHPAERRHRLL
jgi:hypothetical protein